MLEQTSTTQPIALVDARTMVKHISMPSIFERRNGNVVTLTKGRLVETPSQVGLLNESLCYTFVTESLIPCLQGSWQLARLLTVALSGGLLDGVPFPKSRASELSIVRPVSNAV